MTGATKYNVYRKNGTTYTLLTGATGAGSNPHIISDLTPVTDYIFAVSASSNSGEGQKSSDVTVRTLCVPPTNLVATVGNKRVDLSWGASTGARRYTVHRKLPGDIWRTIYTGPDNTNGTSPTTYSDTSTALQNDTTVSYRVLAFNGTAFSVPSNEVSARPSTSALATPTDLKAAVDYGKVILTWAASAGATSYQVWGSRTSGDHSNYVGTVIAPTATFTHANPGNGVTLYYIVKAVGANNASSGESGEAVATTPTWPAPTGVTATPGNGTVTLSWNAVTGATHYIVFRREGNYVTSYDTIYNTTTYLNNGTRGTTYQYYVRAANDVGRSEQSVIVPGTPAPSSRPEGLTAIGGKEQIVLSWQASGGATSYRLYRGTATGTYDQNWTKDVGNVLSFSDTALPPATKYYYMVRSVNANLESTNSVEKDATTLGLEVPTGVSATPGTAQITVAWAAPSDLTQYRLYFNTDGGGNYALVSTINAPIATEDEPTVKFIHNGLVAGTRYYYVVRAYSNGGESASSERVDAFVAFPPTPVTLKTGIENFFDEVDTEVPLSWTVCDDTNFEHYEVHRSTVENFTPGDDTMVIAYEERDSTEYLDDNADAGTTYYYKIVTYNNGGAGAASNQVQVTTLAPTTIPPAAVTLSIGDVTFRRVSISWTPSAAPDFTKYELHRSATPNFVASEQTLVEEFSDVEETSYIDTDVSPNTTYYYKIVVLNGNKQMGVSAELQIATAVKPPLTIPQPVTLAVSTGVTHNTVPFTWTQSTAVDFDLYELHRSETPNFNPNEDTLIDTFSDIDHTSDKDDMADAATTYYYKIVVVNNSGGRALSNQVTATTSPAVPAEQPPTPPTAIVLSVGAGVTDVSVPLTWTRSSTNAFYRYAVYTSRKPNFDPITEGDVVEYIHGQDTLQLVDDVDRFPATTYYYKIVVSDMFGQTATSNELRVTTNGTNPM